MGLSEPSHHEIDRHPDIDRDGFAILESVFDSAWTTRWIQSVESALASPGTTGVIRNRKGTAYAARNLIHELPGADQLWDVSRLRDLLEAKLGPDFVMVRALYFDKHPQRTWSLPWHKDMTIAVQDNSIVSQSASLPTMKAGVPHVEA